jgi:hypothetical protein
MAFPSVGTVLDPFTRADNASIGAAWTTIVFGANPRIVSNTVAPLGTGAYSGAYWNAGVLGPDFDCFIDITTMVAGTYASVFGRWTVGGAGYVVQANATTIAIREFAGGSGTDLASAAATFASGDKVGIRMVGTNISAYKYTAGAWNQTPLLTASDATISAAGFLGWYSGDSAAGGTRLDNFGGGVYVPDVAATAGKFGGPQLRGFRY